MKKMGCDDMGSGSVPFGLKLTQGASMVCHFVSHIIAT